MTGIPRLQLLPAPGSTSGALVVASPSQGEQRVQPVTPATPAYRGQQEAQRVLVDQDRVGQSNRRDRGGSPTRDRTATAAEAANGKLINFTRLSSMPFMVQVLGQQSYDRQAQTGASQSSLSGHRDAALLGSDVYRRAGGEPQFLPGSATFVRLAV